MAEPAREELSALAAIFCGPDEWEVLSRSVKKILNEQLESGCQPRSG